jgi:hypothetical protein
VVKLADGDRYMSYRVYKDPAERNALETQLDLVNFVVYTRIPPPSGTEDNEIDVPLPRVVTSLDRYVDPVDP